MSTPQHAVQSGLIAFLLSWLFGFNQFFTGLHVAFAMQLGAFPDLGRLLQKKLDDWNYFYEWSHKLTWLNILIPYWNIHITEDLFMHEKETGKWKPWVLPLELICWTVESAAVFWLIYF